MAKVLIAVLASLVTYNAVAEDPAKEDAAKYKSSVSDGANSKINMVTSTLQDILQSVVNEEKTETDMYDKYMGWCKTEMKTLTEDHEEAKRELANSKVANEEQLATIDALTLTIAKNEKEMEETKDAIAQATHLRDDENDKYTEDMQLNTQSLRQLDKAIEHIDKVHQQGGFLQNGVLKKLALNQPGESSYVLGVMKGLKDKLTKTRSEMQEVEKEKVDMHNSFMQTKGASMKSLQEGTLAKKLENTETKGKETSTTRKIRKLSEEIESLTDATERTTKNCRSTDEEWKVRQADRVKEKDALSQAIRYLKEYSAETLFTKTFDPSFAQQSNDEEHASVVFVPAFLQSGSASKFSDNAFFAAASAELTGDDEIEAHMKKGSFDGVKGVVQKLIATHQDDAKEEKDKKKFCESEIAAKEDEFEQTSTDLEAVKADVEKKASEVEQLLEEIRKGYEEIDDIKKSLDDATELRKEEAKHFKRASKDRELAVKVLHQAKNVLNEFYNEKKSALQVGAPPPPKPTSSGRKTTASFGAVSMIQDIIDDVNKEQTDAQADENEATVEFETLLKDSRTQTDDKHKDITQRTMAKAKLGVQINTLKETRTQKADDQAAINRQLASLHEQCDVLLKKFDERLKARDFEIAQLRDVNDILSGSSIAARTGLIDEGDQNA